jgi:hypothetical protein
VGTVLFAQLLLLEEVAVVGFPQLLEAHSRETAAAMAAMAAVPHVGQAAQAAQGGILVTAVMAAMVAATGRMALVVVVAAAGANFLLRRAAAAVLVFSVKALTVLAGLFAVQPRPRAVVVGVTPVANLAARLAEALPPLQTLALALSVLSGPAILAVSPQLALAIFNLEIT